MKKNLYALVILVAFVFQSAAFAQAPAVTITAADRRAAEAITASQLSDYLHFVASDEMEGRNTPSRGLDLTAKFIAMNLSRWGFKPAGDNATFFQTMDLSSSKVNTTATTVSVNGEPLVWGTDFIANPTAGAAASAAIVFAGDGWFVKSRNMEPLKGVDVTGKVVAVYSEGMPRGMTFPQLRALGQMGVDYMDPVTYAKQNGAVGVIFLGTPGLTARWERSRRSLETGGTPSPEKLRPVAPGIPVITLSGKASEALLAGSDTGLDTLTKAYRSTEALPSISLSKTVSFAIASEPMKATTQNVVALWEGSDPTLKSEMVAIGSHYDHVGVNPNAQGDDKISNGADDDGSGTVAMLAMAEALAKTGTRPKRSILFVWHCGEEKGLWGSEYFNKFPTIDIKQVIAQLNIDMIGRSRKPDDTNERNKDLSGPNEVYLIGSEMMSSTLGAITKGTNNAYLKLDYNYRYDDPKDTNRFFFRSDHFNYAVNGIPVAFWFTGVHEDYHRVGDHADKVDYAKMEKITRTILMTLLKLAELNERPKIDKQLPPELSSR